MNNWYIRYDLGEDRGSGNININTVVQKYEVKKQKLRGDGFNVDGIFDACVPTAAKKR